MAKPKSAVVRRLDMEILLSNKKPNFLKAAQFPHLYRHGQTLSDYGVSESCRRDVFPHYGWFKGLKFAPDYLIALKGFLGLPKVP